MPLPQAQKRKQGKRWGGVQREGDGEKALLQPNEERAFLSRLAGSSCIQRGPLVLTSLALKMRHPLLLLLLSSTLTAARIFEGTISNSTGAVFLGKFAFGGKSTSSSNGIVGTLKVDYSVTQPNIVVLLFNDESYEAAYNKACAAMEQQTTAILSLPKSSSSATYTFLESNPHYYYFFASSYPDCQRVDLQYTITALQGDGNQLSYDELGLPAIYGCFWAFFFLILAMHLRGHYTVLQSCGKVLQRVWWGCRRALCRSAASSSDSVDSSDWLPERLRLPGQEGHFHPLIVRLFTAAVVLEVFSLLLNTIYWTAEQNRGESTDGSLIFAYILRICSQMLLWCMAVFAAMGYEITTFVWRQRPMLWALALLGSMLAFYIAFLVWLAASQDASSPSALAAGDSWPAILLLVTTILFFLWFVWRIRKTLLPETSVPKRVVLKRLSIALGCCYAILPLSQIVGAACPSWERLRVTTGIDVFASLLIYGALAAILWPSRAADAFRQTATMLSSATDGPEGGFLAHGHHGGMAGAPGIILADDGFSGYEGGFGAAYDVAGGELGYMAPPAMATGPGQASSSSYY